MTVNYNNISSYDISYSAATVTDLYTATSDCVIIATTVTGLYAAGCTVEVQITDGSNNILGYLIPPSTSLSQNNGYSVSDKHVLVNGDKIRIICSVASTSTPMKLIVSIAEGMS